MSQLSLAEFADKIGEIMPMIMREFARQQAGKFYKAKITMPQVVVLDILHKTGESKMTDLAHLLHVTTAAMTGIIGRLVRDHFVVRSNDPADRRIVKVRLTPKGENMVRDAAEERKKVTMKIFGMISQKEREDYIEILMHIRDHLKQLEG